MKLTLYSTIIFAVLTFFSSCGPSAKEKAAKEKEFENSTKYMDSVIASSQNQETTASTDTTKYFELKLVGIENDYGFAKLNFQFKSLMAKHIDKFWIEASLRDKKGEYLAGKSYLMWDNIRPNGIGIAEASWENIKLYEIGGVILTPDNLEIEGKEYRLDGANVKIIENKYGIKVSF